MNNVDDDFFGDTLTHTPEELSPARNLDLSEIFETPTLEDKQDAQLAQKCIDETLAKIRSGEITLATSYARLGSLLVEVRAKKHWITLDYKSFGSYIDSIREKLDKSRAHLYQVISVAEKLLPTVTESQLEKMGISKATELTRLVKEGRKPSPELIAKALDPKTKIPELRAEVFQAAHIKESGEKGKYFEFGGSYLTKDERAEVERAFELAAKIDPVVPHDQPEHVRRKEIMLRLCREFIGTYEAYAEDEL